MNSTELGSTGLKVSEFCLGVLPMGPAQADLPKEKCKKIITTALDFGVNFFDTAEGYKTQPYLGEALIDQREKAIIATKSSANTYQDMKKAVFKSLDELNTHYIDIYHLHAARGSTEVFQKKKAPSIVY